MPWWCTSTSMLPNGLLMYIGAYVGWQRNANRPREEMLWAGACQLHKPSSTLQPVLSGEWLSTVAQTVQEWWAGDCWSKGAKWQESGVQVCCLSPVYLLVAWAIGPSKQAGNTKMLCLGDQRQVPWSTLPVYLYCPSSFSRTFFFHLHRNNCNNYFDLFIVMTVVFYCWLHFYFLP